jgi:hypothetical protein
MLNEELVEKLAAWIEANPEAADTPYMNLSTGVEVTIRNLYSMAQASLAGEVQLDESLQSELDNVEEWIGGL